MIQQSIIGWDHNLPSFIPVDIKHHVVGSSEFSLQPIQRCPLFGLQWCVGAGDLWPNDFQQSRWMVHDGSPYYHQFETEICFWEAPKCLKCRSTRENVLTSIVHSNQCPPGYPKWPRPCNPSSLLAPIPEMSDWKLCLARLLGSVQCSTLVIHIVIHIVTTCYILLL